MSPDSVALSFFYQESLTFLPKTFSFSPISLTFDHNDFVLVYDMSEISNFSLINLSIWVPDMKKNL